MPWCLLWDGIFLDSPPPLQDRPKVSGQHLVQVGGGEGQDGTKTQKKTQKNSWSRTFHGKFTAEMAGKNHPILAKSKTGRFWGGVDSGHPWAPQNIVPTLYRL